MAANRTREIAQWLRVLATLGEDPVFNTSTHVAATTICNSISISRISDIVFWTPAPTDIAVLHTYTCKQRLHAHVEFKTSSKRRESFCLIFQRVHIKNSDMNVAVTQIPQIFWRLNMLQLL